MNKAQRIRDLDNGRRSDADIAKSVGCVTGYVRAVRQRAQYEKSVRPADFNWLVRRYGSADLRELKRLEARDHRARRRAAP